MHSHNLMNLAVGADYVRPYSGYFLLFSFKAHDAASIFRFFNLDFYSIARQKFFYQFRPFDEAEGTAIEIILISHVVYFVQFLDTIEIKMVNKFTGFIRTVFVDNGKSWRVDDICYPQLFAYSFDKCCFTGSHLSVESKNGIITHSCDELFGSFVDRV